jgi:four helix bundle protein
MIADLPNKSRDVGVRTKRFALRIIRLCSAIGNGGPAGVISRQLVRSGTSVGAQYREARRARSRAEFISKVESATQELDESLYWLELLVEGRLVPAGRIGDLKDEGEEIMKMLVATAKTTKARKT